jgi:pyrroline-5-carboxylate reductase
MTAGNTMPDNKPALCFIGFGEAGQAIAAGLRDEGVTRIAAWDILFPEAKGEKLKRAADAIGVRCAVSAADAIGDADLIVSAVTAAASVDAAHSVKPHLAVSLVSSTSTRSRRRASRRRRSFWAMRRAMSTSRSSPRSIRRGIKRRCFLPARTPRQSRPYWPRSPCAPASPVRMWVPRRRSK